MTYAANGELTVIDATGQIWLPRGSAMLVRRSRGNVSVYGRSVSFVLPEEPLSDADIAFLEGHGPAATDAGTPGPSLPLSLEVTQEVQDEMVAEATRVVIRSADFLLLYVVACAIALLATVTQLWPLLLVAAALLLLGLPKLIGLGRMRGRFRQLYPVGRTLRGEVTPEHLALTQRHGTVVHTWNRYSAVRVTEDAVLLRLRRAPFAASSTEVLPIALFRPADLAQVREAVSRTS